MLAVEIKRSAHIQPKETRALREFKKDYPPAKCLIFHGGRTPLHLGNITALPIEQALGGLGGILGNDA